MSLPFTKSRKNNLKKRFLYLGSQSVEIHVLNKLHYTYCVTNKHIIRTDSAMRYSHSPLGKRAKNSGACQAYAGTD